MKHPVQGHRGRLWHKELNRSCLCPALTARLEVPPVLGAAPCQTGTGTAGSCAGTGPDGPLLKDTEEE